MFELFTGSGAFAFSDASHKTSVREDAEPDVDTLFAFTPQLTRVIERDCRL